MNCVAFKPDNPNIVVSGSADETIKTWDITSGSCLSTLRGHDRKVLSVSWSPDGTRLASGSIDTTVMIWDAASGEQLRSLKVDSAVYSVAFSPDSTTLAAGLGFPSKSVLIFDVQSGEQLRQLNVGYAPFSLDLVLEFRWKIAVRFSIRFVKKSSQI